MSLSRWIIAVALGIIALSGEAQEQTKDSQRETRNEQEQSNRLPFTVPVELIENQAQSDTRERRESETSQREIRDLAAQEGMNAATQSMNAATQDMRDYAFYSTILVGIGTLLLFWNLFEIRMANRAAFAGAESARLAIEANRAWVTVTHSSSGELIDCDTPKGFVKNGLIIKPNIENVGMSPALNVRFGFRYRLLPTGEVPVFDVQEHIGGQRNFLPKGNRLEVQIFLNDDEAERTRSKECNVVFYIKIWYEDAYTTNEVGPRVSETCLCATFVGGEQTMDGVRQQPFTYFNVGEQNTAT